MKRLLVTLLLCAAPAHAQVKDYLQAIASGHEILLGNPTDETLLYDIIENLAVAVDSLLAELQQRGYQARNYAGLNAAYSQAKLDNQILIIPATYPADSTLTGSLTRPYMDFRGDSIFVHRLKMNFPASVTGNGVVPVTVTARNYSVPDTATHFLIDASSNDVLITLPVLSGAVSQYTFTRIDHTSNRVWIFASGANTFIDKAPALQLVGAGDSRRLSQVGGTAWQIVSVQ